MNAAPGRGLTPFALYARSRGIPATVAALVCAALLTLWVAGRPDAYLDPYRRMPLISLAPLLTSSAIGVSLHTYTRDLDDTAVRPWWPRRLAHLLVLAALAAALSALAVPGLSQEFGAAAMVRNTLGAVGITAAAAVLLGARLSWMPTTLYFSAVYLSGASSRVSNATVLAWSLQPGPQRGAWAVGLGLFVLGTALCAARGVRPEGPRA
ncbi:hypothetical protein BKI49_12655 [Streptomyces sp. Tue6028]|uniref:hypothetical protein n=1 Tax=Streptomyces sp. Tue6028 TaxID=2036037 RepID=UPI000BB39A79|nr:hypothetical protein [Streptomyces sp. Tue6028]PBC63626.1 hypothetical protein BKI49_12655 [Streptomyces sp. Tue6028]